MQISANNTFFTSDEHYFHENIIKYTDRPWANIKTHNNALVSNYNAVVEDDSVVFHLGDLTMASAEYAGKVVRQVLRRLNGQTRHLILGNHDSWKPILYLDSGFTSVHTSFWFDYGDRQFVLAHDPSIYTVLDREEKTYMLCGHIHKLFKHLLPQKRIINVGVDVWDYQPVSFSTILDLIDNPGKFE